MMPSDRFKHAFKVALALVLTYAIAMGMNWEKPFWAALSVIFCSLATSGESIDRGVKRIIGTVLSGVVVLALIGLFAQDRWLFLLAMSAFLAICTYIWTGGSRNAFIWFGAGFNFPILALLGGGLSLSTFDVVVLRAQETALGVVVYSLVAVLVWPRRGGAGFIRAVASVVDDQKTLLGRYFRRMAGAADERGDAALMAKLDGQLMHLGGQLEGAAYDSVTIWEKRRAWRRFLRDLSAFDEALRKMRSALVGRSGLDAPRFLPGFDDFSEEIGKRLSCITGMLSGKPPAEMPRAFELHVDRDALYAVPHARRGLVLLCRDQLLQIDSLTFKMFDIASFIHGSVSARTTRDAEERPGWLPVLDHDRLVVTVRQTSVLWLLLLTVIYLPGFPNVGGTVALANAFAMAFSAAPFIQARVLMVPSVLGAVFAGALYILVMPHLSSFRELAVLIFAATFVIGYLFHEPRHFAARSMGLAMFVIVIGAENQQSYNFLYFANWVTAAVFFVIAMMIGWRFPISFRPEDRFLAMFARFFQSAGSLLSDVRTESDATVSWRWRRASCLHDVSVLPRRLQAWAAALPEVALGKSGRDELQALLEGIQSVSDRIQALMREESAMHPGLLPEPLGDEMRTWRASVRDAIERLCSHPDAEDLKAIRSRLVHTLQGVEDRVDKALDVSDRGGPSDRVSEEIYRLLGVAKGLSGALTDLIDQAESIDWPTLREARF